MIFPPDSVSTLLAEFKRGEDGIHRVKDALTRISSRSAKATYAQDEHKVKDIIAQTVGFKVVDEKIVEFMLQWVAKEVQVYMGKLVYQRSHTIPKRLSYAPNTSFSFDL